MSLLSVKQVVESFGLTVSETMSQEDLENILVEMMRRDFGPATKFLHQKSHECEGGELVEWSQDPNSDMGKMLIILFSSETLKEIISKHFCHEQELSFTPPCSGTVGCSSPNKPQS